MNKFSIPAVVIAALALVACGQGGNQTSGSTQPKEAEATTPVVSASVLPIANSAVTAAHLTGQPCSLDSIDGNYSERVQLTKDQSHVFRGWLEDSMQKPAGTFQLIFLGNKSFSVQAKTGGARPDVALGQSNSALETAGFSFSVNLNTIPTGEYSVRLLIGSRDGASWCDTRKSVLVQ